MDSGVDRPIRRLESANGTARRESHRRSPPPNSEPAVGWRSRLRENRAKTAEAGQRRRRSQGTAMVRGLSPLVKLEPAAPGSARSAKQGAWWFDESPYLSLVTRGLLGASGVARPDISSGLPCCQAHVLNFRHDDCCPIAQRFGEVVVVDIWYQIDCDHCAGVLDRPITVPSRNVISMNWPPFVPSRSGWTITVTGIPRLSVFGSHPWRTRALGPASWMAQSSARPDFSTDNMIQACGFVHWKSFTVPCTTTSLWASNAAKEWCAAAELTCKPAATPAMPHAQRCIAHSVKRLSHRLSDIKTTWVVSFVADTSLTSP
jgi:hypothetical protein